MKIMGLTWMDRKLVLADIQFQSNTARLRLIHKRELDCTSPFVRRVAAMRDLQAQQAQGRAIQLHMQRMMSGQGCGQPNCPSCAQERETSAAERAAARWNLPVEDVTT